METLAFAALQSVFLYLFIVLGLRWLGKPSMAQSTTFGYLVIALLGSAAESGLYAGSGSMLAGLVSLVALLAADWLLSLLLARSGRLRRAVAGQPLVLVHDGQFVPTHLRRAGLSQRDVQAAVRERGYKRVQDVRLAVLEANGEIGVIPKDARRGEAELDAESEGKA